MTSKFFFSGEELKAHINKAKLNIDEASMKKKIDPVVGVVGWFIKNKCIISSVFRIIPHMPLSIYSLPLRRAAAASMAKCSTQSMGFA